MDELSLLRSELYTGRRALSALQQELTQVALCLDFVPFTTISYNIHQHVRVTRAG